MEFVKDHGNYRARWTFTSAAEMADWVAAAAADPKHAAQIADKTSTRGKTWDLGVGTLSAAVEMTHAGWDEHVADVSGMADGIVSGYAETYSTKWVPRMAESGDEPDVARYLAGRPDCMFEYRRRPTRKQGRVVRILANGCFSGGTSARTMVQYGAALLALCEVLRSRGLSPEIWIEATTGAAGGFDGRLNGYTTVLYCAHHASDVLDIGALMFPIAHPAFFRKVCFAVWATEDARPQGMYRPCAAPTAAKEDAIGEEFHIVIGDAPLIAGERDAVEWIRRQLEAIGLDLG